jgi:RNA polymerase-binding transcription factor DksA
MPTKKKAAKPAPRKKTVKPAKTAPKKVVKAGSKSVKQVKSVKKAVAKKKTATKAKKAIPKPKQAVKKVVKKAVKPVVKKTVQAKPVKKVAPPKAVVKKAASPAKPVKVAIKPVAQKEAIKKPEVKKVAPAAPKETAIKAPVQQAIKDLRKNDKQQPAKPVVVKTPKTTVSTSVKYQPDFTKSVLDTGKTETPQGPMVRYSDAELQEFKELILRKLEASKKELVYLQGVITRKDEGGGDDADGRYMTMEDGSVSMEREQLSQMASRQITYIDHLEKALMRIENKTYGVCRVTGKLIDKARLRAVPHATLSMEAKLGQHKISHGE